MLAGSSSGAVSPIDHTTITTVSSTMQMNSENTRSGQVKMRSSDSVFSKVGSPDSASWSFFRALCIDSQKKKPTRNTIITMGTLSSLVTMSRKSGLSSESRK